MQRLFGMALLAAMPAVAQDDLKTRLDALSEEYARLNINAVVLVGNRDGVLYETAFGQADLDERRPMTVATRFKTESVGKIFTATRVLQLVEQGKLKLDDSAAQHLPHWSIPGLDKITVAQLLRHTGGLASMWDHPAYDFSRAYTAAEMKKIIEEVAPVGAPGEKYFYSNSGYYLLGEIIAAVTGRSFDQDIHQNVFARAGMADTDHLRATAMPADAAQPYIYFSSNDWRSHTMGVSPLASPAGGWISTARDLFAFGQSYLAGKFIGAEMQRRQWTANGDEALAKAGNHYAYGVEAFVDTHLPGRTIIGHSGGGGGFSVDLFMDPASGTIAVVMCNIYAMNREMSTNYLAATLGLQTRPARHSRLVRSVDHLLLKGAAHFEKDPAQFFGELDIATYSEFFLAQLADFAKQVKRDDLAQAVERTSARLYAKAQDGESAAGQGASAR